MLCCWETSELCLGHKTVNWVFRWSHKDLFDNCRNGGILLFSVVGLVLSGIFSRKRSNGKIGPQPVCLERLKYQSNQRWMHSLQFSLHCYAQLLPFFGEQVSMMKQTLQGGRHDRWMYWQLYFYLILYHFVFISISNLIPLYFMLAFYFPSIKWISGEECLRGRRIMIDARQCARARHHFCICICICFCILFILAFVFVSIFVFPHYQVDSVEGSWKMHTDVHILYKCNSRKSGLFLIYIHPLVLFPQEAIGGGEADSKWGEWRVIPPLNQ